MYDVSEEYKAAMKKPAQIFRLFGKVGSVNFTEKNILKGSFRITNQISDTSEVKIGSVYIGQLTCTFNHNLCEKSQWKDLEIRPYEGLMLQGGFFEDVPLGVYYISEANYSAMGVEVTAYDGMSKFDKSIRMNVSFGTAYDFLTLACNECGISLATEREKIEAMPNGDLTLYLSAENDIETWRDLLYWIAQTLCCVATMSRNGGLLLLPYTADSIDTVDEYHRFNGCNFSDFETEYSGISYVEIKSNRLNYYGLEEDTKLTYNLGQNPFLQSGGKQSREAMARAILTGLQKIKYVPFSATILNGPVYDLGDVIVFSGGSADNKPSCIMSYDYTYNKGFEIEGFGKNPLLSNARNKTDKNLMGLLNNVSENEMAFYEVINASAYHIGDGANRRIVRLKVASKTASRIQIHIEVNLIATATEEGSCTGATVEYMVDSEAAVLHPQETYIDGAHIMHLMYILPIAANATSYFVVNLQAVGGAVDIEQGGIWLYASGLGIVGDGDWNGEFDLEDLTTEFAILEMGFKDNIKDSVDVKLQKPVRIDADDETTEFDILEMNFEDNIKEKIRLTTHSNAFDRALENVDGNEAAADELDARALENTAGAEDVEIDVRLTEQEVD